MIYKATNNINGKVYIGQTVQPLRMRKSAHKKDARKGSENYFHRAIRKYGFENFYWIVINKCDDIDTLNLLEQYYISYYNSTEEGYNLTTGGENCRMSEETKKKMSLAQKGKNNVGKNNGMSGKKHSFETIEKLRQCKLGRKHSKETKKKISKALLGNRNSVKEKTVSELTTLIDVEKTVNSGKRASA